MNCSSGADSGSGGFSVRRSRPLPAIAGPAGPAPLECTSQQHNVQAIGRVGDPRRRVDQCRLAAPWLGKHNVPAGVGQRDHSSSWEGGANSAQASFSLVPAVVASPWALRITQAGWTECWGR